MSEQELFNLYAEDVYALIRIGALSMEQFEDWMHNRIESVVDTYAEGF